MDKVTCPTCNGSGFLLFRGRGDPNIKQEMYAANKAVREYPENAPTPEWRHLLAHAERMKELFENSK
jgi:hypothetical protein